jgi:hypothetical protein
MKARTTRVSGESQAVEYEGVISNDGDHKKDTPTSIKTI